ncbi:MAG: hypothetical protein OEZ10_09945 [Gammaproteobacteria bacterium]|nr:hypothetical protein [Gammaproteobacteria bacterium]
MMRSLMLREVLPFLFMLSMLFVGIIAVDQLLHVLDLVWVGRYLGIPGVLLILLAFMYSLRKRRIITLGKASSWLRAHEAMTWTGSLLILVHAGVHFNAVLPWLATLVMTVNVISGLVGKFLLDRSRRELEARKSAMTGRGMSEADIERTLFWDAVTLELMKKWRAVHFPITLAFVVLALGHIISIFLFWQWR